MPPTPPPPPPTFPNHKLFMAGKTSSSWPSSLVVLKPHPRERGLVTLCTMICSGNQILSGQRQARVLILALSHHLVTAHQHTHTHTHTLLLS